MKDDSRSCAARCFSCLHPPSFLLFGPCFLGSFSLAAHNVLLRASLQMCIHQEREHSECALACHVSSSDDSLFVCWLFYLSGQEGSHDGPQVQNMTWTCMWCSRVVQNHEMQPTSWACVEHAEQAAQTVTTDGEGANNDKGSSRSHGFHTVFLCNLLFCSCLCGLYCK